MKTIENIKYAPDKNDMALDVHLPDGEVKSVLVYFHGGGLFKGDKSRVSSFSEYLADHGIATVTVNYRMYPDAVFPDYIVDSAASVAWAYKYAKEELHCDKLYVSGSSAGGYLTMMLCFDKRYLAAEGLDNSIIAGYLHNAGQPTAHYIALENRGIDRRRVIVDETAPLYYVGLEKEYPLMRFIVADNDMTNRLEQTLLMLSTLKHFEYTGFDHIIMPGKHCNYNNKFDENGINIFGKMILEFINDVESGKLTK